MMPAFEKHLPEKKLDLFDLGMGERELAIERAIKEAVESWTVGDYTEALHFLNLAEKFIQEDELWL